MDQFTADTTQQKIPFLHSGIPDCTSPVVSYAEGYPEYPGIHGTGFFARKGNFVIFITARHCLVNNNADDVRSVASRLQVPYALEGYKSSRKDYVEFDGVYSFSHQSAEIPGKYADFVILTIKIRPGSWQDKHLRSRAAKLPPTGNWLDDYCRAQITEQFVLNGGNIPMLILGYPHEGTSTEVSTERGIFTQRVIASGMLRPGVYPYTMSLVNITWSHDLNGFSGSPVFLVFRDMHGPQYALAGMIVLGGNRQAQFIRISQILGSTFNPPLGFDLQD